MEEARLQRLEEELNKARRNHEKWGMRVKELEQKYENAENTCIHDMVHAAQLTPEQLAQIIRLAREQNFRPSAAAEVDYVFDPQQVKKADTADEETSGSEDGDISGGAGDVEVAENNVEEAETYENAGDNTEEISYHNSDQDKSKERERRGFIWK